MIITESGELKITPSIYYQTKSVPSASQSPEKNKGVDDEAANDACSLATKRSNDVQGLGLLILEMC